MQICRNYGNLLRYDESLLHLGFLPEDEDAPRMLLVDHRKFRGELGDWLVDEVWVGECEADSLLLLLLQLRAYTLHVGEHVPTRRSSLSHHCVMLHGSCSCPSLLPYLCPCY